MLEQYVALDVETTGLNPQSDSLIEIALLRVEKGQIVATYQSLVNPRCRLSLKIKRLTGITDEMLQSAPFIEQILPEIRDFIGSQPLVGHSVLFDKNFLEAALGYPLGNPIYDTCELARYLLPEATSYRLTDLCLMLGVPVSGAHRAVADARAAVLLFEQLTKRAGQMPFAVLKELARLLDKAGSSWAPVMLSAVPRAVDGPALAGPEVVSRRPYKAGEELPLELSEVTAAFSPQGVLAQKVAHFEFRPQQQQMAAGVARAFNEKTILLQEAGTGTGKSMAYLLPALFWLARGNSRVVVATRTLNLQEQLWQKDAPGLMQALDMDIPVALAKGKQNYVCLRRWQAVLHENNLLPEEAAFYARVLVWLSVSRTGDRSELNLNWQEAEYWRHICAESDFCAGSHCVHFAEQCYVMQARRALEAAGLIITNHALLFADLAAEYKILPAYGPLIIDEAHHLEDAATEQLSRQISYRAIGRWQVSLSRLLTHFSKLVPPRDQQKWLQLNHKLGENRNRLREYGERFFRALVQSCRRYAQSYEGRLVLRLTPDVMHEIPGLPLADFSNLLYVLRSIEEDGNELGRLLLELGELDEAWEKHHLNWQRLLAELAGLTADLEFIFGCASDKYVYWVECGGEGEKFFCELQAAPIFVGNQIHQYLFAAERPVILTSATLTVGGSFEYYKSRVGLDRVERGRIYQHTVPSPFHYHEQARIYIVNDLAQQGEQVAESYLDQLTQSLQEIIRVTQGRTLVLFTSHRALKEVYWRLLPRLEEQDIYLLGHNIDGGRTRLLEEFRRNSRSVLLGSASFWEGVDLPGDALRCVVIVKLPFWPPGMPIVKARMEELESRGVSSFYNFSLPQAIIRFKQGFGRLIRTARDRGAVVILDGRLVEKKYGRLFLQSLPLKDYYHNNTAAVCQNMKMWLHK
ncbi:MAG: helicase C-terminal domain-containing protein [Bacillota bacterium]